MLTLIFEISPLPFGALKLRNNSQIFDLIKNDINNNDYLMVKASNATGFNKIVNNLKGLK